MYVFHVVLDKSQLRSCGTTWVQRTQNCITAQQNCSTPFVTQTLCSVWCMCFVLRWTGHSSRAVAPPGFREHRTASPHSRVVLHPTSGHTQGVDLWGRHRDRSHQWRRGQWSMTVSKEYSGTFLLRPHLKWSKTFLKVRDGQSLIRGSFAWKHDWESRRESALERRERKCSYWRESSHEREERKCSWTEERKCS